MSKFSSNTDKMKSAAEREAQLNKKLQNIEDDIREVMNQCVGNYSAIREIKASLNKNMQNLSDNRKKLSGLSEALLAIASEYEKTENRILDQVSSEFSLKNKISKIAGSLSDVAAQLGVDASAAYSKDPVNLSTGNYIYEKTFLSIDSTMNLRFRIFYNSQKQEKGILGKGWTHVYETKLQKEEGVVHIQLDDGAAKTFLFDSEGTYTPAPGTLGSLSETENGYVFVTGEGLKYLFDSYGRMEKKVNIEGEFLSFEYEKNALIRVSDGYGNSLKFEYGDQKIKTVSDQTGRKIHLEYEGDRLISVKNILGRSTKYNYNDRGWLSEVINSKGIVSVRNEYDENGRAVRQIFPDGGCVQYEYLDDQNLVCMTEQNGNQVQYEHDALMRNVRNIYADGEEIFTYNEDNLRTSFTDKRGNTSRYRYDKNGNITHFINANGDETELSYTDGYQVALVSFNGQLLHEAFYDERHRQREVRDALGGVQKFEYDESNQPVVWIREDGSRTEMTYDESGNLTSISNAAGGITSYKYDELHRVIATQDPNGGMMEFVYNEADELVSVRNEKGKVRTYEYDECGNMVCFTDYNGAVTRIRYNDLNKPVQITDPLGNITYLEYDKMWNICRQVDACGGETKYQYDALHRLTEYTDANGSVQKMEYDACGNLVQRTAEDGGIYRLNYDKLNRPNRVQNPMGRVAEAEYDAFGNVTKMTFPDGKTERNTYDILGRVTSFTDRSGYTRRYEYNLLGDVCSVSDDQGILAEYEYYPGGLLKKECLVSGREREFIYDKNENIVEVRSSTEGIWIFQYDQSGQMILAENAGGAREAYEYDETGNIISVTDGEGNVTRYQYDLNGNMQKAATADGAETHYVYDGCNRLIHILQSGENGISAQEIRDLNRARKDLRITSYQRDGMGNILRIINAEGDETAFTYDGCGRILSRLDPDGTLTRCEYNSDGTERAYHFADGRSVMMEYDALKNLIHMQDWLGEMKIQRDSMGRPEQVELPDGKHIGYQWGVRGERKQLVYTDGTALNYAYDEASRLISLETEKGKIQYDYYPNGKLKSRQYPYGFTEEYSYHPTGSLSGIIRRKNANAVEEILYHYNKNEMKSSVERRSPEANIRTEYHYNAAGSLTEVLKNGAVQERYGYDSFGNRTFSDIAGKQSFHVYNRLNQLVESRQDQGLYSYHYDKRGNLAEEFLNGQSAKKLAFGALNLLESVKTQEGEERYSYNGLGLRVAESFTGKTGIRNTEDLVYDITRDYSNLMSSVTKDGFRNHVWDRGLLWEESACGSRFFMNNERQAPDQVLFNGSIVDSIQYDSFGNQTHKAENSDIRFGLDGYRVSKNTGYAYAHAREYDAAKGRFLSRDPFPGMITLPLTLNAYAYCMGDPINYHDPTGMVAAWIAGGLVGMATNVCSRLASDVVDTVVTSVATGKLTIAPQYSSWQNGLASYLGSAAGGFASGAAFTATLEATGNFAYAGAAGGAAGGAVETFTSGAINMVAGVEGYRKEDGYTLGSLVKDSGKSALAGAATGFAFGAGAEHVKIQGITAGKGSNQATWKQWITNVGKGDWHNADWSTIWKGVKSFGIVGGLLEGIVKGLLGISGLINWVKAFWNNSKKTKVENVEVSANQYLSGACVSGECPAAGA